MNPRALSSSTASRAGLSANAGQLPGLVSSLASPGLFAGSNDRERG